MSIEALIVILPALTFGMVLVWAYLSKRRTEQRMEESDREKSSLAKDG
ncbi:MULTISPECIES: hypothetical protein [Roseobacteraceae]|nr:MULTISPECIES: hypothetical protein [Roseobacteraceae]MBV7409023.1 hypothetical protein [Maritimibacter sp. DP1N21-5]MBY5934290.1 hypothetical protein [Tateyamaria omphalii]